MTNKNEIEELYASFARMYANGTPIRGPFELVAAIRAAGLDPGTVTDEWLESLNRDWVYGDSFVPFQDAAANRLYHRFLTGG